MDCGQNSDTVCEQGQQEMAGRAVQIGRDRI